ncbi:MAG TPA: glucosamine-6-phosphate deaminase [Terracidiphilus sp.]|nr:glucosamine-6-phosphate deaminase [Terracidiphilus sp.]
MHNNSPAIHVAPSRSELGARAAADIASEMRSILQKQAVVRIMFAAAPSQSEMLGALRQASGIDWSRLTAFHMDEYIGLAADASQRFGVWLGQNLFDYLPFGAVHLIDPGNDPGHSAVQYAAMLRAEPIDIVCCGIGVNGHLAFNDPPADFDDPLTVRVVSLDERSRQQQVDDKCFASIEEVPTHAITATIPALLAARSIFCTVPGSQKNQAIRNTLDGPITPMCPATALRRHPRCRLYLDADSAAGVSLEDYPQA